MSLSDIEVRGAREHNLDHLDLTLPRNRLICFTGVSGSGKSSLAFDTLYAEGQRRYIESLSSYARQYLGQPFRGIGIVGLVFLIPRCRAEHGVAMNGSGC